MFTTCMLICHGCANPCSNLNEMLLRASTRTDSASLPRYECVCMCVCVYVNQMLFRASTRTDSASLPGMTHTYTYIPLQMFSCTCMYTYTHQVCSLALWSLRGYSYDHIHTHIYITKMYMYVHVHTPSLPTRVAISSWLAMCPLSSEIAGDQLMPFTPATCTYASVCMCF